MSGSSSRARAGAACFPLALALLAVAGPAAPQGAAPGTPAGRFHRMEVLIVAEDVDSGQPVVLLRSMDDRRQLPMFIGPSEAQGIAIQLGGLKPPRPLTHDLIGSILRHLNATVEKVVITDLRGGTYFATLYLRSGEREIAVDSRPSDAIAVALRNNAPILADERLLRRAAPGPAPREVF